MPIIVALPLSHQLLTVLRKTQFVQLQTPPLPLQMQALHQFQREQVFA